MKKKKIKNSKHNQIYQNKLQHYLINQEMEFGIKINYQLLVGISMVLELLIRKENF